MSTTPTRRSPLALVAAGAAALILSACGGGGGEGTSTSATLPTGCEQVSKPPPKHVDLKPPRQKVSPTARLTATVDTSCGSFEIALDARDSPKTVASFAYLARKHVYDDTVFHRIVPGFLIQGGDPTGTGSGGPGYSVDEPPPPNIEYRKGVVAMAKTKVEPPGRSGSQFFVVTAIDAGLPPQSALLGRVSAGEDAVGRIAKLGNPASGQTGTPLATVVIRRITIAGRPR